MQIFCKENFSLPFFFNLYINPKAGNPSAACFSNSSYYALSSLPALERCRSYHRGGYRARRQSVVCGLG